MRCRRNAVPALITQNATTAPPSTRPSPRSTCASKRPATGADSRRTSRRSTGQKSLPLKGKALHRCFPPMAVNINGKEPILTGKEETKMEKKVYETPQVTKVEFDASDRITASGCGGVTGANEDEYNCSLN